MESPNPVRVLVVTDRTAAPPALVSAIRARAKRGPVQFRVIVPNPAPAEWHPMHPERRAKAAEAERVLARALPAIEEAAGLGDRVRIDQARCDGRDRGDAA